MKRIFFTDEEYIGRFFNRDAARKWVLKEEVSDPFDFQPEIAIFQTSLNNWVSFDEGTYRVVSVQRAASLFLQYGYNLDRLPTGLFPFAEQR